MKSEINDYVEFCITMIDDVDFDKHKKYKEYVQYIRNKMLKLCGIPKDLYEKRKKINNDTGRKG